MQQKEKGQFTDDNEMVVLFLQNSLGLYTPVCLEPHQDKYVLQFISAIHGVTNSRGGDTFDSVLKIFREGFCGRVGVSGRYSSNTVVIPIRSYFQEKFEQPKDDCYAKDSMNNIIAGDRFFFEFTSIHADISQRVRLSPRYGFNIPVIQCDPANLFLYIVPSTGLSLEDLELRRAFYQKELIGYGHTLLTKLPVEAPFIFLPC